jgi:hypothetical protein
MEPRHLEVAAEFCRMVGKNNLLEYLGLADEVTGPDALEALRKKRRYMQGMQANPKYKAEAVSFIKNFGSLAEVMASPADYLREARRLSERTHIPVLEMTIRGSLRGGPPTAEQIAWLERNASELGVSPALFKETLDRVLRDAGFVTELKGRPAGPTLGMFMFEADDRPDDPWDVLGVPRTASLAEIEDAWRDLRVTAEGARLEQLDRAWKMLHDAPRTKVQRTATDPLPTEPEPARRGLTDPGPTPARRGQTDPGPPHPPARRGFTDPGGPTNPGAPTAPPVRERTFAPSRAGSLQSAPTAPPIAPAGANTRQIPVVGTARQVPVVGAGRQVPVVGAARQVPVVGSSRQATGEMKTLIITGATKPTFEGENPIRIEVGSRRQILRARLVVSPNDASEVRFETTARWATPETLTLEANRGEHEVLIEIDPAELEGTSGIATITASARGERGQLTIVVQRRQSGSFFTPFLLGIIVAVVAVLVLSAVVLVAFGFLK